MTNKLLHLFQKQRYYVKEQIQVLKTDCQIYYEKVKTTNDTIEEIKQNIHKPDMLEFIITEEHVKSSLEIKTLIGN